MFFSIGYIASKIFARIIKKAFSEKVSFFYM